MQGKSHQISELADLWSQIKKYVIVLLESD
jgi:hypothetical protein